MHFDEYCKCWYFHMLSSLTRSLWSGDGDDCIKREVGISLQSWGVGRNNCHICCHLAHTWLYINGSDLDIQDFIIFIYVIDRNICQVLVYVILIYFVWMNTKALTTSVILNYNGKMCCLYLMFTASYIWYQ